jgi:hypothetical protein
VREAKFVLEMHEDAEALESIYLDNGFGWREIFPHEVEALFDLKETVLGLGTDEECAFTNLVRSAEDIEVAYKKCVEVLRLKSPVKVR